jgi:superfamily II DNA or RNA helicase
MFTTNPKYRVPIHSPPVKKLTQEERVEVKKVVQAKSVLLSKDNPHILLSMATGVGKTLTALKIACEDITETKAKWVILVKEISHIETWEEEFIKHKLTEFRKQFHILCYASLKTLQDKNVNLILDEVHGATSEIRLALLSELNPQKILALSATLETDLRLELEEALQIKFLIHHISLNEAISLGLVPAPEVNIITIELDETKSSEVFVMTKGVKDLRVVLNSSYEDRLQKFGRAPNVELRVKCTPKEYYYLISEAVEYNKRQYFRMQAEWAKFKWLGLANQRKKWLGEQKTKLAKSIISKELKGKKFICFSSSIAQCKILGGEKVIHSKQKTSKNKEILDSFKSSKIKSLYSVNMGREALNIPGIQAVLVLQIDNKELALLQTLGRALRSDDPLYYLLVVRETRDEEYFHNVTENLDKKYLKIINL